MSQQLNGAVKNTTVTAESESNDEVWRRFSEDDGESDIDWDEATLAKLLEFDDDDSVAGSTVSNWITIPHGVGRRVKLQTST